MSKLFLKIGGLCGFIVAVALSSQSEETFLVFVLTAVSVALLLDEPEEQE